MKNDAIMIEHTVTVTVLSPLSDSKRKIERWITANLDPARTGDVTAKVTRREVAK